MKKSLKENLMRWLYNKDKTSEYDNWTIQRKEEVKRTSVYFFRNVIH
ncbi:MAG: hypothetical protein JXA75_05785 [Candidatus Thermoplasmatota archaeon]|nr:hypothetical protein [Candidatus Thermoplasmatota archaeon]